LVPRALSPVGIVHAMLACVGGVYRFEDLRVRQAAKLQCDRVGGLIRRPIFKADPELTRQMNAAGISVMNNIGEGFLRRRDKEFAQFLRIAAGSNGEVRACYHAARGRHYLSEAEADELIELSNSIGRMTRRLLGTLRS
jgi:four helix bundle protein